MTLEQLILEVGEKIPDPCQLCRHSNLWKIEGDDKKPAAKVCSWCDVEVDKRWAGFK